MAYKLWAILKPIVTFYESYFMASKQIPPAILAQFNHFTMVLGWVIFMVDVATNPMQNPHQILQNRSVQKWKCKLKLSTIILPNYFKTIF